MALPEALLNSLAKAPGFMRNDFETVHASGEQIVSIRKNPAKETTIQPGIINEEIPWCPHGFYLKERPFFTADPLLHAGAYYVQEASSMFLWHMLSATIGHNTANKKVLDLSAAPGGKTTLLLSYFTDALVVANEVIKTRASILVENTTKWGADNIVVTNNDPSHFQKLPSFFDVIVVDAPCSGSGLFRKDPDAIHEWSTEAVSLCSARQERILSDILSSLAEDGWLFYSTCSYSIEENEGIAKWLVDEMDMEPVLIPINDSWNIVQTTPNGYRFYPNRLKGEGFFAAAFRKKKSLSVGYIKETPIAKLSNTEKIAAAGFYEVPANYFYFKNQDEIRIFKSVYQTYLQQLAASLYIKKAGVGLGSVKGKDFIPSHEFALSFFSKNGISQVALNNDMAMNYLRKKDFSVDGAKGWTLFTYQNQGLGWAKLLSNRLNNYYPTEWRIRKDSF